MKILNEKDFWIWPLKKWWVYAFPIILFTYDYETPVFFMWEVFFGDLLGNFIGMLFFTLFFRYFFLKIRKKYFS